MSRSREGRGGTCFVQGRLGRSPWRWLFVGRSVFVRYDGVSERIGCGGSVSDWLKERRNGFVVLFRKNLRPRTLVTASASD